MTASPSTPEAVVNLNYTNNGRIFWDCSWRYPATVLLFLKLTQCSLKLTECSLKLMECSLVGSLRLTRLPESLWCFADVSWMFLWCFWKSPLCVDLCNMCNFAKVVDNAWWNIVWHTLLGVMHLQVTTPSVGPLRTVIPGSGWKACTLTPPPPPLFPICGHWGGTKLIIIHYYRREEG
jgi:hypothetical protein